MKGQHMTDDELIRYNILVCAFDYVSDENKAMALAERMRRFVYGLGHETPAQARNLALKPQNSRALRCAIGGAVVAAVAGWLLGRSFI